MKTLFIRKISLPEGTVPQDIPALFDRIGLGFNPIGCDNWNWSDSNPDVRFRIAHASDCLILHFHVRDREVRAVNGTDNGRVWEDACCEFFVSPDCDDNYYNFECNCIGTLLLHGGKKGTDRGNAPEEVYRSVLRWSRLGRETFEHKEGELEWDLVEIIPASALFNHGICCFNGKAMRGNFYKCGDLLSKPHYLSWSPIDLPKPAFHCPQFFGELLFE